MKYISIAFLVAVIAFLITGYIMSPTYRYTVRLHYIDGGEKVIYYESKEEPSVCFTRDAGYRACGEDAVCRIEILSKKEIHEK